MLSGSVGFAKVMAGQRAGSIHTGEEAPFDIGQGEQAVLLYRIYNEKDNTPPGAMFGPEFHKNNGRHTTNMVRLGRPRPIPFHRCIARRFPSRRYRDKYEQLVN